MPADLLRAVEHAHFICSWQENLPEDEQPPEWMWSLDHELADWFDQLDRKRNNERDSGRDTTVPLMDNELSRR